MIEFAISRHKVVSTLLALHLMFVMAHAPNLALLLTWFINVDLVQPRAYTAAHGNTSGGSTRQACKQKYTFCVMNAEFKYHTLWNSAYPYVPCPEQPSCKYEEISKALPG